MAKKKTEEVAEGEVQSIRFCVPTIGTKVALTESWTFNLYHERRNASLMVVEGVDYNYGNGYGNVIKPVTFPAGTVLTVSRIYIRSGAKEFDSITFHINKCPDLKYHKKRIRFWAKLADVNSIICQPIWDSPKTIEAFKSFGHSERVLAL